MFPTTHSHAFSIVSVAAASTAHETFMKKTSETPTSAAPAKTPKTSARIVRPVVAMGKPGVVTMRVLSQR
ncbi:hypothetical protein HDU96_005751 [Phlyctochytrium bullatum]|nr:hypothetical protein HDU96_005751 [Phlyctochytrium bullatum]